jgi:hypothetical protein
MSASKLDVSELDPSRSGVAWRSLGTAKRSEDGSATPGSGQDVTLESHTTGKTIAAEGKAALKAFSDRIKHRRQRA